VNLEIVLETVPIEVIVIMDNAFVTSVLPVPTVKKPYVQICVLEMDYVRKMEFVNAINNGLV